MNNASDALNKMMFSGIENHMLFGGSDVYEPKTVYICDGCNNDICEGYDSTDIEQSDETYKHYCSECIIRMTHPAEFIDAYNEDYFQKLREDD